MSITRDEMDRILSSALRTFWIEPPSEGWDDVLDLWCRVLGRFTADEVQAGTDSVISQAGSYREITPANVRAKITGERSTMIREILGIVADETDATVPQLVGPGRAADIAQPRQLAMLMAREVAGRSMPQIGREIGNRDHTTVLYGCRKAKERLEADRDFRGLHSRCLARLAHMQGAH